MNKDNLTHDMVMESGKFNLSVISERADFELFRRFGFQSGRTADQICRILFLPAQREWDLLYHRRNQCLYQRCDRADDRSGNPYNVYRFCGGYGSAGGRSVCNVCVLPFFHQAEAGEKYGEWQGSMALHSLRICL